MIINPTSLGGGGEFASIFVTGLTQSDTVSGTKPSGGSMASPAWVTKQTVNPSWRGLPSGYTQLDYIESSGTQYINTGYIPDSTIRFYIKTKILSAFASPNKALFGEYNDSFESVGYFSCEVTTQADSKVYFGTYGGGNYAINCTQNTLCEIEFNGTQMITPTGTVSASCTITNQTSPIYLFARSHSGSLDSMTPCSAQVYSFVLQSGTTKVIDFVPCKRDSDNAIGMYDMVSETFFANSGTGTFTAGDETSHYSTSTSGWEFSNLAEYGTYTITATDGTQTATQAVLVDAAEDITVAMSFSRLPEGYTEVEYIQSSGAQRIDTGLPIIGTTYFRVVTEIAWISLSRGCAFGKITQSSPYYQFALDYYSSSEFVFHFANDQKIYLDIPTAIQKYKYDLTADNGTATAIVDDVQIGTASYTSSYITSYITLYLFVRHNSYYTAQDYATIRMYSFKAYTATDTLARDFVPCINPSNEVGMYDLVSETFFSNSGSGTFIAGDPV